MNWENHFDKNVAQWQEYYERKKGFESHTYKMRFEYVFKLFDEHNSVNGTRALDIGCGPGIFSIELLKRGMEVWGIDISSNMVEHAIANAKENGFQDRSHFSIGDIESLSFPDENFDFVLCLGVFSYVKRPEQAIKQIYRVLKPNGIAIITMCNHISLNTMLDFFTLIKVITHKATHLILNFNSSNNHKPKQKTHRRTYNVRKFDKFLENNNFQILNYMSHRFGPMMMNRKNLFSDGMNLAITQRLEKIAETRWIPILKKLGSQYIIKVEKQQGVCL